MPQLRWAGQDGSALEVSSAVPDNLEADTSAFVATIILPAYNEAAALPSVLKSVFAVVDQRYEVIVVDDASADETSEIAGRFPCRVLHHKINQGKGAAVRTGLAKARGDFVIVMDADNTYPAEAIPQIVRLAKDYDFVRAFRVGRSTSMPLVNRVGNLIFDFTLKLVHGLEGADHLTGLYGLRREAFAALHCTADRFDLEVEIGIKARAHQLRVTTFPINYQERLGEKKLRVLRDGWSILWRTLSMAPIYNPVLMFVAPGACVWILAALLTLILSGGSVMADQFGLSTNSLIVASLGMTTGFQLIVFGIAAALYSVERGVPPRSWLLALATRRVRLTAAGSAAVLVAVGIIGLLVMILPWIGNGASSFYSTGQLVVDGVMLLVGMQVLLSALFLSMFADQLSRRAAQRASQARIGVFGVEALENHG